MTASGLEGAFRGGHEGLQPPGRRCQGVGSTGGLSGRGSAAREGDVIRNGVEGDVELFQEREQRGLMFRYVRAEGLKEPARQRVRNEPKSSHSHQPRVPEVGAVQEPSGKTPRRRPRSCSEPLGASEPGGRSAGTLLCACRAAPARPETLGLRVLVPRVPRFSLQTMQTPSSCPAAGPAAERHAHFPPVNEHRGKLQQGAGGMAPLPWSCLTLAAPRGAVN